TRRQRMLPTASRSLRRRPLDFALDGNRVPAGTNAVARSSPNQRTLAPRTRIPRTEESPVGRFLVTSALAVFFVGCGDNKTTAPVPVPDDAAVAASLWAKLTAEHYAVPGAQWKMFPGRTGLYAPDTTLFGANPHLGPNLFQTFVDAAAHAALSS